MPAGHMTEEEYAAFKNKSGYKEPQKVKTYYEENKRKAEALKHHQERAEQNRNLRDKNLSTTEKFKRAITKKEPADQKIKTNYKPKDAPKPEPKKASGPSNIDKAKGWLKDRSVAIAQNTRDIRPPRGSVYGAVGMGLPQNPDLFGVGGFGSIHGVMRSDPFQEMQPRRPPAPAPQRKKKRKRKQQHRAPQQSGGGMPPMMGIPSHMKWMF